jgi:hypothetical protein
MFDRSVPGASRERTGAWQHRLWAVFGAYDRACSASCRSLCWTSA